MQATHTHVSDTIVRIPVYSLSARNALWLLDQAGALRTHLGTALRDGDDAATAEFVREHLPAFCTAVSRDWLLQLEEHIVAIQHMIKRGHTPAATCLAEEIMLYAMLGRCTLELESSTPPTQDPWYLAATSDETDFDVSHLYDLLVEEDTSVLFDPNFDVCIDDADDEMADMFGISHPSTWFDPFHPPAVTQ